MKRIVSTDEICLEDIASFDSPVSSQQANAFCHEIAAKLTDAIRLFEDSKHVEVVFRNILDKCHNPRGTVAWFEIQRPPS